MAQIFPNATARCLCGDIEFRVKGAPLFNALCHCSICRFNHGTHYAHLVGLNVSEIEWIKGEDKLKSFLVPAEQGGLGLKRAFCSTCGTPIWNDWSISETYKAMHFVRGVSAVLFSNGKAAGRPGATVLPDALQPQIHIFYENRVRDVNDGLPHFRDLPKTFGGSDELVK